MSKLAEDFVRGLPQVVTAADVRQYIDRHWVTVASSFGRGSCKTLDASFSGEYRVTSHIAEIYRGSDLDLAVFVYSNEP
jgi:hypothetical protein